MKKKALSLALSLLMALSLLPASVLTAAAADAYQVLFEPQLDRPVGINHSYWGVVAYGDTAAVYSVTEKVYRFVRFTGNNLENIPGEFDGRWFSPLIGKDYIMGVNSYNQRGVIDKKGQIVVDFDNSFGSILRPDDSGIAKATNHSSDYYLLNLNTKENNPVTKEAYERYVMNGYSITRSDHGSGLQVVDPNGVVLFSDADKDYDIYTRSDNRSDPRESIKDGMVIVEGSKTHNYGAVNLNGEIIIPTQYIINESSLNGYIRVYDGQRNDDGGRDVALFDKTGNIVIPFGTYAALSDVSPDGLLWGSNADGTKVAILKVGGGFTPIVPPEQPAGTQANPTNDKLTSDGVLQNPTVYKIGDSNYFKIRDLAAILNGTEKQFSVGYDNEKQSVTATTGQGYTKLDGDLAGPPAGQEKAEASSDAIYVNGQKVEAEVYKIGGNNYFKLRDLGKALDFYVGWSKDEGIYIDSGRSYDTD